MDEWPIYDSYVHGSQTCPKCGVFGYFSVQYVPALSIDVKPAEHMRVSCAHCGWSFRARPKDAQTEVANAG